MFIFLYTFIHIGRKSWIRGKFRHPLFNEFTCFEMSCKRFDHLQKMFVCLFFGSTVCMSPKIFWRCISRTNERKFMKLYYTDMYVYILSVLKSSALLSCYNLCMVNALQKGGDRHTNLNCSFLIIYIIVPLCRRKFCDSHVILVFFFFFAFELRIKEETGLRLNF